MDISPMYGFVTPCIGHLEHIGPLTYTDISNIITFHSKIQIITSIIITTNPIRKKLYIEKLLNLWWWTFSNILIFDQKLEFMTGKRYQLCPWSDSLTSLIIKKVSAKHTG